MVVEYRPQKLKSRWSRQSARLFLQSSELGPPPPQVWTSVRPLLVGGGGGGEKQKKKIKKKF